MSSALSAKGGHGYAKTNDEVPPGLACCRHTTVWLTRGIVIEILDVSQSKKEER